MMTINQPLRCAPLNPPHPPLATQDMWADDEGIPLAAMAGSRSESDSSEFRQRGQPVRSRRGTNSSYDSDHPWLRYLDSHQGAAPHRSFQLCFLLRSWPRIAISRKFMARRCTLVKVAMITAQKHDITLHTCNLMPCGREGYVPESCPCVILYYSRHEHP